MAGPAKGRQERASPRTKTATPSRPTKSVKVARAASGAGKRPKAAAKSAQAATSTQSGKSSKAAKRRTSPKMGGGAGTKSGPVLLSGGNPQIAKADGNAPVQAYIAAMPEWKRQVGARLDALVERTVPNVRKAVKWNSPFYGVEGQGWFLSFHVFTKYVKVTFFQGTSLRPPPPGGTGKDARWIDVHEDDLDEAQMTTWIRQAASLPGWLA